MASAEKVIIRLTSDTVEVLETLIRSGDFPNLSEIMMKAVEEFIDSRFTAEDIVNVLDGSERESFSPDQFTDPSDGADLDTAVRTAVSTYIKNRMDGKK
ncbi:MAG: hypothetical protein GXX87_03510 [Euryarchaeota archaeon]|jgi:Arc/MetJ-type ribon-helix-helix transcriptional regulator|nr:hypothetical protein [Euryarchaeota archaeon]